MRFPSNKYDHPTPLATIVIEFLHRRQPRQRNFSACCCSCIVESKLVASMHFKHNTPPGLSLPVTADQFGSLGRVVCSPYGHATTSIGLFGIPIYRHSNHGTHNLTVQTRIYSSYNPYKQLPSLAHGSGRRPNRIRERFYRRMLKISLSAPLCIQSKQRDTSHVTA